MNDVSTSLLSRETLRQPTSKKIVIIGGGPSGLAAALETVQQGAQVVVLEKLDRVGGLARTLEFDGNRFDIGPHRFFTLNEEVKELFIAVCGPDLINVPKLTRIHYRNKYFDYPLTPLTRYSGSEFHPVHECSQATRWPACAMSVVRQSRYVRRLGCGSVWPPAF